MESPSLRFAATVRALADVARAARLIVPSFRSPPGAAEVQRSITRRDGAATVAVRVRDRPFGAVAADVVEGIVVANRLDGPAAQRLRDRLWAAVPEAHWSAMAGESTDPFDAAPIASSLTAEPDGSTADPHPFEPDHHVVAA